MPASLRIAFRKTLRSPGYAVAVVLTLALTIGVNTAVFTMLDGFLLRQLPYPQLKRLAVLINHVQPKGSRPNSDESEDDDSADSRTWQAVLTRVPSVEAAATGDAFGSTEGIDLDTGEGSTAVARYVQAAHVSAHYFQVLGVTPMMGRGFTEAEDSPGAGKSVVISYALWSGMFGKNPHLLGSTIRLKGAAYTVVGIMSKDTVMPHRADVWIPLMPSDPHGWCGGNNCLILMRLKPGENWQQVRAELAHMPTPRNVDLARAYAWYYPQLFQQYTGSFMKSNSELLMLAVSFILLIACANLAGLAMVRIARQTPEIATRLALGASYGMILRQLWVESLLLSAIGASGGVAIAEGLLQVMHRLLPDYMIPIGGLHVDSRVLLFTTGIAIVASLLFGALPALQARRINIQQRLSSSNRTFSGGTGRMRQMMIGAEVALTLLLLAGAGLLVRTVVYLETLPPGFDPHHVLAATVSLDNAHYQNASAFQTLLRESVAALKAIPGVQDAGMGLSVPYQRGLNDGITIVDGKRAGYRWGSSMAWVTPGYFATLRMPILAGRTFDAQDNSTSQAVAIINAAFAQEFYRTADPIGLHFKEESTTYTIVGVVPSVAKTPGMTQNAPISHESVFYIPAAQADQKLVNLADEWFQPSWIVRADASRGSIQQSMQKAISSVAPDLPIAGFYSMEQIEQQQLQTQRVQVLLLSVLAGLALLLSIIGVYGMVSNLVVQRTREIGIRIALGSPWERVILAVGLPGVTAALGGVVVGLIASFFALRVLKSAIYGIHALDPLTLTAVPLLLLVLAVVASLIPSLRATQIDPVEALREG